MAEKNEVYTFLWKCAVLYKWAVARITSSRLIGYELYLHPNVSTIGSWPLAPITTFDAAVVKALLLAKKIGYLYLCTVYFIRCVQYTSNGLYSILHTVCTVYFMRYVQYTSYGLYSILYTVCTVYFIRYVQYTSYGMYSILHTLCTVYFIRCVQYTSYRLYS